MENFPSDSDLKDLVKELSQGRELAKQLQLHLNAQSSSSHESRQFLLQKILYSYDHALSMLTHTRPPPPEVPPPAALSGSDDSDQDFKDQASKKRNKEVARWSQKIKVSLETGIEGQLDDGYAWRKYGQKDILGAKYPRGYYRCTYRHSQGCLAAKQVQRCDEDPSTIEITYRRKHTCNPRANTTSNNPPVVPDPQNETDPNPSTQNPAFNIQTSLRVMTPDENPPFNFANSSSDINPENDHIFSHANNILGNYINYPIPTSDDYGELIPNLHNTSDSELSPIVAAAVTSTTNSATLGTDFPFGSSGFGSNFNFGNPGFYP